MVNAKPIWTTWDRALKKREGWKDSWAVQHAYCSSREPAFSSQHMHRPVSTAPADLTTFSGCQGYSHTGGTVDKNINLWKGGGWNALKWEPLALPMDQFLQTLIFNCSVGSTFKNEKNPNALKGIFWICKPLLVAEYLIDQTQKDRLQSKEINISEELLKTTQSTT